MAKTNMVLISCAGFLVAISACASKNGPYRVETGDDGIQTRIEMHGSDEPVDIQVIESRMKVYRNSDDPAFESSRRFDPFVERNCPPEGSATEDGKMKLNRLKNRTTIPTESDIDHSVTLAEMRRPGNDKNRWSTSKAVVIEGYVNKLFGTGAESCNCKATSRRLTDTHIDLLAKAGDSKLPVIVEITPPLRLIHEHNGTEDWSTAALKAEFLHRKVRVTGWLFYDDIHESGSSNIDPKDEFGEDNWRATAWEVHPVTSIELLE